MDQLIDFTMNESGLMTPYEPDPRYVELLLGHLELDGTKSKGVIDKLKGEMILKKRSKLGFAENDDTHCTIPGSTDRLHGEREWTNHSARTIPYTR